MFKIYSLEKAKAKVVQAFPIEKKKKKKILAEQFF